MREVGALINLKGEVIAWHLPQDRTGGSLPDSRHLWDLIWENKEDLWGFAHSHPGSGVPGPSHTDITTFAAIEGALGKTINWWITSSDTLVVVTYYGPEYITFLIQPKNEPSWVKELRERSEDTWVQRMAELEEAGGGFPGVTGAVAKRKTEKKT